MTYGLSKENAGETVKVTRNTPDALRAHCLLMHLTQGGKTVNPLPGNGGPGKLSNKMRLVIICRKVPQLLQAQMGQDAESSGLRAHPQRGNVITPLINTQLFKAERDSGFFSLQEVNKFLLKPREGKQESKCLPAFHPSIHPANTYLRPLSSLTST